jgi:hypothetical protein
VLFILNKEDSDILSALCNIEHPAEQSVIFEILFYHACASEVSSQVGCVLCHRMSSSVCFEGSYFLPCQG